MKKNKETGKEIKMTRRGFMGAGAAIAAFTIVPRHVLAGSGQPAPSDTLNIGKIGCGGMQGGGDLRSISRCEGINIYALCDVDENQAGNAYSQYYETANLYWDFRKMLEKDGDALNGIVVTIPDHMHATASLMAMDRGIAVYCQKPLVQSVWEARLLKKAQQKYPNVATQMGNQGYSSVATRVATEYIWNGAIGDVTEVHSFNGSGFARGIETWPPVEPVPEKLNWDLWQGHAREHTYSSEIHPSNWRGFLEYGTMMIGDWGIHQLGPANWALGLSYTHPTSVTCTAVQGANPVTYPSYSFVVEFPSRPHPYKQGETMPPVKIYWYEGTFSRSVELPESVSQQGGRGNEVLIGTKGAIGTGGRGESVTFVQSDSTERPPEMIPRVQGGHFQDWVDSIRSGNPSCSNFNISAPYTEWMLLGAISWRFPNEKLEWDGDNLKFTNNEKANEYIKPYFRPGWELEDITI